MDTNKWQRTNDIKQMKTMEQQRGDTTNGKLENDFQEIKIASEELRAMHICLQIASEQDSVPE